MIGRICLFVLIAGLPLFSLQEHLRTITGTVVDPDGRPVANASIGDNILSDWSKFPEAVRDKMKNLVPSDSDGKFTLQTHAPCIFVRKIGYQSWREITFDEMPVRVVLHPITRSKIKVCASRSCATLSESGGICLGKPNGLKVSEPTTDIDYKAQNFSFRTPAGWRGIRHGEGSMWSFGVPSERQSCSSVAFKEDVSEIEGMTFVDTRGQAADGTIWRYLGRFGDSAEYEKADQATAKILDRALDQACVMPSKLGHKSKTQ